MSQHDQRIREIASLVGVAEAYTDAFGRTIEVAQDTQRAILSALGLPVASEAQSAESLDRVRRLKLGLVPAVLGVDAGRPSQIPLRAPGAEAVAWRITEERGAAREGRAALSDAPIGRAFVLPALLPGYHRLRVQVGHDTAEATLIAAPHRCWEPRELREGARLWGATAQLYALRSSHDFGIGDYAAVGLAAEGVGGLGASFLGLSPVHALFSADRSKISPYSPSSRLFLETLFINPMAIEGFGDNQAAATFTASQFQERLRALRDGALVDHAAAWDLKRPLLDSLWSSFQQADARADFESFRRAGGEALEAHATFEALAELFRQHGRWWLGDWPEPFRHVASDEVRRFRVDYAERVAFHAWLQWLADLQLGQAAERAHAVGMGIGLYRDLAVGADRDGSEIWAHPDRFATALSVGAPPDPLGPQGQDWGLPPFDPLALEAQGLAGFRALVTANMRHAGAIRIDHAFQLARLFLIPAGAPASQGAYVDYPFRALLATLRLESHRARCLVIAEDLGTAPEGFSDAIMEAGVLSYRVLPFERAYEGAFKPPGAYPRSALAVITTHDLPTFRGWWRGLDVDLRQTLGVFDADTAERERASRAHDRRRLAEALAGEGLLPGLGPPEQPPLVETARFLARTDSSLAGLQLEDAAGELNQANLPGLDAGHPNWRRRLSVDIETLTAPGGDLAKLAAAMAAEGRSGRPLASPLAAPPPRATYRLQFHKAFTFDDAAAIVPYLARLGVSHVYASPIHKARPGSAHGYDIVDHAAINPELGGEEGFVRLSDALKAHSLGLILDIVPNHMGVGGADNGWWLSTLEWGELSPHSRAFDVDWERLGANHKLVVPFLADRYGDALEKGDLKLAFDAGAGSFSVWHWEHRFPISPPSYPLVLDRALAALGDLTGGAHGEVLTISARLRDMSEETNPERRAAFPGEAEDLKYRLAAAVAGSPELAGAIERGISLINGAPGFPDSFGTLHRILEMQAYRLAHWRVAASDINYRRFFDINALAGMRAEDPEVFARTHQMVFRLIREGRLQGLRIDHIDGLADPEGYVRAVQAAVGPGFYVVIEKILEPGEQLRSWPVSGTTGYDVLNLIDGVTIDGENADAFERLYRETTGLEGRYGLLLREAKTETLENSFASELEVLVSDLKRIADADRRTRDYTVFAIRRALTEIIARFPVYRTYLGDSEIGEEDRRLIEGTVEAAKRSSALPDRTVHDLVAAALLGGIETEGPGRPASDWVRRFRGRFQQLTGPVMAKSLEDTLFYRYARLISANEVGGDPGRFGVRLAEFHRMNRERASAWPHALIATATHDTKRGEDARARLNALSELPDAWAEALERWRRIAGDGIVRMDATEAPDANDRYLLLEALLGAWPIELLRDDDAADVAAFRERMEAYVTKALREAKRHTSWVHVNDAYEKAALGLVQRLLSPKSTFLDAFRPLARRLAYLGMLNGLTRTALKCTLPGVPDVYQGTELWDFALVDPDNRRPVDYGLRRQALETQEPWDILLQNWTDGRVKQRLLARLLADRAAAPHLYAKGDYRPMEVGGVKARHVIAFLRIAGNESLLVLAPRLLAKIADGEGPMHAGVWGETAVRAPGGWWRDVLRETEIELRPEGHPIGELFADFPIAVLRRRP